MYFIKSKINLLLIVIFCVFIITMTGCSTPSKNTILLLNNSKSSISNASLKYTSSGITIAIGELKPNSSYTHKIEDNIEDSITLIFTDSMDKEYSEVVVGYTTSIMEGVTVSISDNNDNSSLCVNIK